MGANWAKAGSSRIIVSQPLTWTGSGTIASTNFSPQTYQVRVISQIPAWISIDGSTASLSSTTTMAGGTYLAANTASGDFFAVNPGQLLVLTSTATSTGVVISLTEMS
jgi:hypothetical protein